MADNVELNPGTGGALVATDDDGTAQHQYVKLEYGADGTFTKVATGANALPVQGAAAHDAAAAGNPVLIGGFASAAAPTNVTANDAVQAWFLQNGAQVVQLSFSGTLPTTGNGGVSSGVQRVTIANDSTGTLSIIPNNGVASSGLIPLKHVSDASTNGTTLRAAASNLYGWSISNTNASPCYVKFFNKNTTPTVGTDTVFFTVGVNGVGTNTALATYGITFSSGISIGITTGPTDADTGAVAANEVIIALFYK